MLPKLLIAAALCVILFAPIRTSLPLVAVAAAGAYIKGRILDVSKGAARSLAFIRDGLARVQIAVLAKTDDPRNPWFRMARCEESRPSPFSRC